MRRRSLIIGWVLVLGLITAGCGSSASQRRTLAGTTNRAGTPPSVSPHTGLGSDPGASGQSSPVTNGSSVSPSPTPSEEYPAPVEASLSPTCVYRLGALTLTVKVGSENAVVAYQAVYSDGNSGAKAPWGKGYGGNDGGQASPTGQYTSTWTVAANAPLGPARVDIYAAVTGVGKGFKSIKFEVRPTGQC